MAMRQLVLSCAFLTGCTSAIPVSLPRAGPNTSCIAPTPEGDLLLGVALSGGGSRAAVFGAASLEALGRLRVPGGGSVLEHVGYLSSVSGGSVAASYYAGHKPSRETPVLTPEGSYTREYEAFFRQFMEHVAHDRRGHGRSSQASSRNDRDGYADDLAAVLEALDLKETTLAGHSTGGGEVARYIGPRDEAGRESGPRCRRTADHAEVRGQPGGPADGGVRRPAERRHEGPLAIFKDLATPFYGADRSGAKVSQGTLDQFWLAMERTTTSPELRPTRI